LIETSSDTILELSNGCLCCSIRGEMVDTLLDLDASRFDRIIIETTGIADPLPIFQSLAFHPTLAQTYSPAEILTVYDSLRGESLLDGNDEAKKQLSIADVIILSKHDLGGDIKTAKDTIQKYNQTALIVQEFKYRVRLFMTLKNQTHGCLKTNIRNLSLLQKTRIPK